MAQTATVSKASSTPPYLAANDALLTSLEERHRALDNEIGILCRNVQNPDTVPFITEKKKVRLELRDKIAARRRFLGLPPLD